MANPIVLEKLARRKRTSFIMMVTGTTLALSSVITLVQLYRMPPGEREKERQKAREKWNATLSPIINTNTTDQTSKEQ